MPVIVAAHLTLPAQIAPRVISDGQRVNGISKAAEAIGRIATCAKAPARRMRGTNFLRHWAAYSSRTPRCHVVLSQGTEENRRKIKARHFNKVPLA